MRRFRGGLSEIVLTGGKHFNYGSDHYNILSNARDPDQAQILLFGDRAGRQVQSRLEAEGTMFLSGFVHRGELFQIAERWFREKLEPSDARRLTEILIADGFILGETLQDLTRFLVHELHPQPAACTGHPISFKGQLRNALLSFQGDLSPRVRELLSTYQRNPDFFYRDAPINGVMYLGDAGELLAACRIKRPRRVAEKANRRIASWLFSIVQSEAEKLAGERASRMGVPLSLLLTPEEEMVEEFAQAEEIISRKFISGEISFDPEFLTIHDVGGIKMVGTPEELLMIEESLSKRRNCRIVERESLQGLYNAVNLIVEIPWNREEVCRRYEKKRWWEHVGNRGLSEAYLRRGLANLLGNAEDSIKIEVILTTFPDLVESELGNSIHEKRIITQRDNKDYKGNIPLNIEFLVEYLFAVGFSPRIEVDSIPIHLWGRYLPDTLFSHIRRLHNMPPQDLFY
jgi:hypothetical protein